MMPKDYWRNQHKKVKEKIFKHFNNECKECKSKEKLHIHHLKYFVEPKELLKNSNRILFISKNNTKNISIIIIT